MKQVFPTFEQGSKGLELTDTGMTLRDYFAAKAMQANLNSLMSYEDNAQEPLTGGMAMEIATESYRMADAMMKARGEP